MNSKLPPSALFHRGDALRCPWCDGEADGVKVTLGALWAAHDRDQLAAPDVSSAGRPSMFALVASCDVCAKPFAVELALDGFAELHPVRTAADLKLIEGGE